MPSLVPDRLLSMTDHNGILSDILRGTRFLLASDDVWINAELTQIQEELDALSQLFVLDPTELELYHLRAKYSAVKSPVYRLPPELMLDIFHWAAFWSPSQNILDPRSVPWTLGQVCARWREMALNCTSLWQTIVFTSPYPTHSGKILAQCLARSRDRPIDVSITFLNYENACRDILVECIRLLCVECRRWRRVQFDIPSIDHDMSELLGALHGKLPSLEGVYFFKLLSWTHRTPHSSPLDAVRAFLEAPLMKRADLRSLPFFKFPPSPIHLTHFGGNILQLSDVQRLSCLPSLVECHLCGPQIHIANAVVPITLANLRRLSVQSPCILQGLTTPNLTSLSLFPSRVSPHDLQAVQDFVARSACVIQILAISLPSLLLFLHPCFRDSHMRSIKRFCLSFYPEAGESTATFKLIASDVLPQIDVLTVVMYSPMSGLDLNLPGPKVAVEALMEMVAYRFEHAVENKVQKLGLLRICLCSDEILAVLRREGLARFEANGLVIEQSDYGKDKHWTGPFWFLEDDIPL
ncbi:hypothetical protein CPB85DRAFT_1252100 [Mucidula mucida]|nr:hypothetical protein CPB85DRAFT_1252100 [Mucidula mucida]